MTVILKFFTGSWKILLPETKFKCKSMGSNCQIEQNSATIAYHLTGDEWIVGIKNGYHLKMVHLKVTGTNSYEWISTKYELVNKIQSCLTSFSQSCFVGTKGTEDSYLIDLVAEETKREASSQGKILLLSNSLDKWYI